MDRDGRSRQEPRPEPRQLLGEDGSDRHNLPPTLSTRQTSQLLRGTARSPRTRSLGFTANSRYQNCSITPGHPSARHEEQRPPLAALPAGLGCLQLLLPHFPAGFAPLVQHPTQPAPCLHPARPPAPSSPQERAKTVISLVLNSCSSVQHF